MREKISKKIEDAKMLLSKILFGFQLGKMYRVNIELSQQYDAKKAVILGDKLFDIVTKELDKKPYLKDRVEKYSEKNDVARSMAIEMICYALATETGLYEHIELEMCYGAGRPYISGNNGPLVFYTGAPGADFPIREILHEFTHFLQRHHKSSLNYNIITMAADNYVNDVIYKKSWIKKWRSFAEKIYKINLKEKEASDVCKGRDKELKKWFEDKNKGL
ncbi:MAG: hypothetical protein FWG80_03220 [Alphaproteobacteria bacterium]|nr:hypothetical protein [Alphaproteobacteria bacterium]